MNLQEALGVYSWTRVDSSVDSSASLNALSYVVQSPEVWCVADGLDQFWQDADDVRWRLLVNIIKSIGYDESSLHPMESIEDLPHASLLLDFDVSVGEGLLLPSIADMIIDPLLKKACWSRLCENRQLWMV